MNRPLIYLACPYSHPDAEIRNSRVELASLVAAKLMQQGTPVYSPITHGHAVAQHLPPAVSADHRFWMRHCKPFMEAAREIMVLPMHGWRLSKGVQEELDYFYQSARAVTFLELPRSWNLDKVRHEDLDKWRAMSVRLTMMD